MDDRSVPAVDTMMGVCTAINVDVVAFCHKYKCSHSSFHYLLREEDIGKAIVKMILEIDEDISRFC